MTQPKRMTEAEAAAQRWAARPKLRLLGEPASVEVLARRRELDVPELRSPDREVHLTYARLVDKAGNDVLGECGCGYDAKGAWAELREHVYQRLSGDDLDKAMGVVFK